MGDTPGAGRETSDTEERDAEENRRTPPHVSAPHDTTPDAPDSPWRTLEARAMYRNRWLHVTEYQVIRPDGQPGIYGVVNPGDNVTIAALDDDERLWLIRDFFYPVQRYIWALPSGSVEEDEDPLRAAQRELAEEAGAFTASDDDWSLVGAYYLTPGVATQRSYLYLARHAQPGLAQREGSEQAMSAHQVPLRDMYGRLLRGEINTAVTALGVLHAWLATHGPGAN